MFSRALQQRATDSDNLHVPFNPSSSLYRQVNLNFEESVGELPAGPLIYQLFSIINTYWEEPKFRYISTPQTLKNAVYQGIETNVWSISKRVPTQFTTVMVGIALMKLVGNVLQKTKDWDTEYDNPRFTISWDGANVGMAVTSWSGGNNAAIAGNDHAIVDNSTSSALPVAPTTIERRESTLYENPLAIEVGAFGDVEVKSIPQPEPPIGPRKVFELFAAMMYKIWDHETEDIVWLDISQILIDSVPGVYMKLTLEGPSLDLVPIFWGDFADGMMQILQYAIDKEIWYSLRSTFAKKSMHFATVTYGLNPHP